MTPAAIRTERLGKTYIKRRSLREMVLKPFARASPWPAPSPHRTRGGWVMSIVMASGMRRWVSS
jgi:hypothetical protein